MAKTKPQENKPLEQMLFLTADKLRKNIDAAEYKSYVLVYSGIRNILSSSVKNSVLTSILPRLKYILVPSAVYYN